MSGNQQRDWSFRLTIGTLTAISTIFLILPLVVIVAASFGEDTYLRFPPRGLTLEWYAQMATLSQFAEPLWVSLRLGVMVAVISAICGGLAAFALNRAFPRSRRAIEGILLAPVLLPTLVIGLALLVLFNVAGITNAWLTLTLGHVVVTLPFVLQAVNGTFSLLNPRLEQAAMTLGAGPLTVLLRIVLPLMAPGMLAGGIISFSLSFDEFVVSVLLAQGPSTTFPVQLFQYMRFSVSPTVAAISTILIVITILVIFIFHRIAGIETLFGSSQRRS